MNWLEAVWWRSTVLTASAGVVILGVVLAASFGWAVNQRTLIMLGALVFVALIPIFIRWPVVSTFGLYALLLPFDALGVESMSPTKPIAILASASLLGSGLLQRRLIRPPIAALWWGIFILWAAASAAWALHPEETWRRLPTVISLFLLYIAAVSFKPSGHELASVCVLAVIGGAVAAGVAYTYGVDDTLGPEARGRLVVGDLSSNPNGLAEALMVPFVLAIGAFIRLRATLLRATAMALVVVIGLGVYVSMSRAAILSIVAIFAVFLYRLRIQRQILIVLGALVALAATMPVQFYERMTAIFNGDDPTGSGRTEIWSVAIDAVQRFGVFGAGLENFVAVHEVYAPHGPLGYGFGAHNSYLMVWVELGIIGLASMLFAFYCHLAAAGRLKRRDATVVTLEAACIAVLVLAFFGDIIWTKLFWLPWILLTWAMRSTDDHGDSGLVYANDRTVVHGDAAR